MLCVSSQGKWKQIEIEIDRDFVFSILFSIQVRETLSQQQKHNQNTHSSTNSNLGNQKLAYHTSSSSEQLSSPSYRPSAFSGLNNINPSTGEFSQPSSERRSEPPVAKVAERVKLKSSRSDSSRSSGERPVFGSEISNSVSISLSEGEYGGSAVLFYSFSSVFTQFFLQFYLKTVHL